MIRAVLIDFDGVLRRWDRHDMARAEGRAGLPDGAILRAAFDPALLLPALTGRISDEAWRQQVAERLRVDYPAARAELAVNLWSESPGEIDQSVLSLVRSCRERAALVLATNATTRLNSDLARLGLTMAFDHVINSSVVGYAKPDPEIFTRALAAVGVTASEALFIDDDARNVEAATRLGIAGHHFRGLSQLLRELVWCNLVN